MRVKLSTKLNVQYLFSFIKAIDFCNFTSKLQQNSEGTITFKLVPADGKGGQRESKVRVRAHFEYNPENDPYIPCKEAGLAFSRGDILHIVGQVSVY